MKSYLDNHANDFDCLFFYHIRSSQYLPRNYYGETIIELGDLYSENYLQTFKKLNFLNPLKYIYYFESLLVKKMEKKILSKFDKIILFSKNEVKKIDTNFKQKIFQIGESVDKVRNFFSYSKKNFRILFVGNLNYLPNFLACKKFVKEIFPTLQKKIPNLKFCIIGDIGKFRKKLFSSYSNVEVLGLKKNLSNYIKTSFCGLANMEIATGIQGKVLTYMSHGLPVICSDKVSENFGSTVLKYKDNSELIRKIIFLKNNKSQSNQFSKKSLKFIKKQIWKRISKHYLKLINF